MKVRFKNKRLEIIVSLTFSIVFIALLILNSNKSLREPQYIPGTYQGFAEGYYSLLEIEVLVDEYKIKEINILSHQEPEILSDIVFIELPAKIIRKNSVDVDVVSGATQTSLALLEAVENALIEARFSNQ